MAAGTVGSVAWNECSNGWNGCRRLPSSGPGAAIAARAATAPLTSTATRPCGGWKKSSANSRLSSTACGMPRTRLNSTSSWPNIAARSRDSPISRRASDHLNAFPASGEGAASQKTKMGKWGGKMGKMGKMGSESICDLEIDSDPNSCQFDPDPNSTPIRPQFEHGRTPPASDDTPRVQLGDRSRIVAELAQHRLGVLALVGCWAQFVGLRVAAHMDRLADHFLRSELGVVHGLGDAKVLNLRIGKGLVDRIDRPARHTDFGQQVDPISVRMPAHDLV